jgi:DNA repair protein SbcD/Mre11
LTLKFAHITDCHLGSWRNPKLRELNLKAFEESISICIHEHVNFIVVTGDFFDVNVPDLAPVKRAVEILRDARSKGIEIYMIYGSHDFTANSVSIIDILHSAGLFIKPVEFEQNNNRIRLKFSQDAKTLIKITGLSGRKIGLDLEYYKMLDLGVLESEEGFKIFLFHAPITEFTPIELAHGDMVPFSLLPKGFKYYGGGHLHKRLEKKFDENSMLAYPGPLFGSTFTDLENTAEGEKRGFYIVDLSTNTVKAHFTEVKVADFVFKKIDANQKTAKQVDDEISSLIETLDAANKIVLLKVKGTLSSGKRSDINFSRFEELLRNKGAIVSFMNRSSLTSAETFQLKVIGESVEDIEKRIVKERIASFKLDPSISDDKVKNFVNSKFIAEKGQNTARALLHVLKKGKLENENNNDYSTRMIDDVISLLEFKDLFNN